MEFAVILVMLVCYALAAYVWWLEEEPHYLFTLLGGHLAALLSPLWAQLYDVVYSPAFSMARLPLDQSVPRAVVIGSAWFYPLPALLVLYLYQRRWWFPGYVSGLLTYGLMLLYHLLIQALGLRGGAWRYGAGSLLIPGLPPALLAAAMGALVSLGLLYTLLITQRYAWLSLLLTLLPATLLLSLLVHGLLGASLWVPLLLLSPPWSLTLPRWLIMLGLLATVTLLGWAIHIGAWGLGRFERRTAG
jgi:hypothetical protein